MFDDSDGVHGRKRTGFGNEEGGMGLGLHLFLALALVAFGAEWHGDAEK